MYLKQELNPVRNKSPKATADAQAQRISNGVKISSIAHIGILLCLIIGAIISPRYRYNRATVHTVQLISMSAIRPQQAPAKVTKPAAPVKEVKKTEPKKETKKLEPKPKAITIPKKITTPSLEEKLEKRLEAMDKKEFTEAESITPAAAPQLNIGISSPSNFPFQFYLDWIHDKISASWHEPQMVLDKRYTAIVTFTILQDGSVQNIYVKKGSGLSNFDQSGLRAVESARPFPPLPQGYSHPQLTVNVTFNLE